MEKLKNLPVFQDFTKIRQKWKKHDHLILKSPTGSGKSIALPYLLKSTGLVQGKVLVIQPRRIAARLLAKQVAKLFNWELGHEVGYQVRFDKTYTDKTQIIYATDGIVLNKLLGESELDDVDVLILDEFHERSAQLDLCLALAKKYFQSRKKKVKLVVTSATLDRSSLVDYIPDAAFLELSGRSFPVEVEYKKSDQNLPVWRQVVGIIPGLLRKMDGDLLIFMDGVYEISRTIDLILSSSWSSGLDVYPLYGNLPFEKQDMAILPAKKRKIIVSTNIAETSLTIEGVKIVLDTGKAKKMSFDNLRGINALLSEPISKSSADQRSGRAGRLAPGFCLRLWSEAEHDRRMEYDSPEIGRIDLSEIYLNLAAKGIAIEQIDLLSPVSEQSVSAAKERLKSLEAINDDNELTAHGHEMSLLPMHPNWAHALLVAKKHNLVPTISLVLALLEGRPIIQSEVLEDFFPMRNPRSDIYCTLLAFEEGQRRGFSVEDCKKIGLHSARCKEAKMLTQQFCKMVGVMYSLEIPPYEILAKLLIQCFPQKVVQLVSGGRNIYQDCLGRNMHLSKHSVVKNEKYLISLQVIEKKLKGRVVLEMNGANGIDESWVRQNLGRKIKESSEIIWDANSKKVVKRTKELWKNLVFSVSETEEVSIQEKSKAYSKAFIRGDFKLKNWNAQVEKFLNRQSFLSKNFIHLGIREMDFDTKKLFLEQLFQDAGSWKEIKNTEVYKPLLNCYSQEEIALINEAAPEFFDLGMGKRPYNLDYASPNEVVLRAVLQDLYDIPNHPTIVFGEYPLIVEILAPNRRPVQRTTNLISFWEGSYINVRKDLMGRYPKHEWR